MEKYDSEICKKLLCEKSNELKAMGIKRYPQRSDFTEEEVIAVKAFLGPWPRALEKAGLKPINEELKEKKRKKRIAAKIKKRNYKIEAKKAWHEAHEKNIK